MKKERRKADTVKTGYIIRVAVYLLGIILVSTGIVFCKKSNLGISPVSSIPYVMELVTPVSFGMWTMIFHFSNTVIQMILIRKINSIYLWLQFLIAFIFGQVIDMLQKLIVIDGSNIGIQIISLILSVLFTAAGMVCMIRMNLVQNPPDGTVKQISQKTGTELGKVKIIYDCLCVLVSAVISVVLTGRIEGFGIATIVSAIFVGKCVTWINRMINRRC